MAGAPSKTPRQLVAETYRQAGYAEQVRTLPLRPMSARATYLPPSTPQYMVRTMQSERMERELASLVYSRAPRWPSQDLAAENAAYAQLSGKAQKKFPTHENMMTTNRQRSDRFRNCPWAGDAGTQVLGGNKWKRGDEYDANRDMTMVPLNQLSDYLRSFARPTTHLEGLKKVGCVITIQSTMRRKLEMTRHRMRLEAMRAEPPAAAPADGDAARQRAARVIQSGLRRAFRETEQAVRQVRVGRVDEAKSNYATQQRKVREASVRAAGILNLDDGLYQTKVERAALYQGVIEDAARNQPRAEKDMRSHFHAVVKIAAHERHKLPAAGGATGSGVRLAAERAMRRAPSPRVLIERAAVATMPPWGMN